MFPHRYFAAHYFAPRFFPPTEAGSVLMDDMNPNGPFIYIPNTIY